MGNTCQKLPKSQRNEISSLKHQTSKRRKLRNHDIISIEIENPMYSGRPTISPIASESSERCDGSIFDDQTNDEHSCSLHGIGIEKNPFYGSPTMSTGSSSTMSSFISESETENSLKRASLVSKAIDAPMLPPLEQSYEEDESVTFKSQSSSILTTKLTNLDPIMELNTETNVPTTKHDKYLSELMQELEEYDEMRDEANQEARLEATPTRNQIKNFRSILNRKVQEKLNQCKMEQLGQGFKFPTPPSLKLPSAFKRKGKAPQMLPPELEQRSSPLLSANKSSDIAAYAGHGGIETKSEYNLLEADSPKKFETMDTANSSLCVSEASSPDIFDQIRSNEVPDSLPRSSNERENVAPTPQDLQFYLQEAANDDESMELLSLLSDKQSRVTNIQRSHIEESVLGKMQQLSFSDAVNIENTSYPNPSDSRSSQVNPKEGFRAYSQKNNISTFKEPLEVPMKEMTNIDEKDNTIETDIVTHIKERLLSVKKLLTPKNDLNSEHSSLFGENIEEIVPESPLLDTRKTLPNERGNANSPTTNKLDGAVRNMQKSKVSSLLRSISPRQNLKAVKRAMSPKKYSYKRTYSRKQNGSTKMLLVAENAASNVRARITELNGKLMRTREMRRNIHGENSENSVFSGSFSSNQNKFANTANFRKYAVANSIMRDRGASIVKKSTNVWTNCSLDGAGSVWRKKEEGRGSEDLTKSVENKLREIEKDEVELNTEKFKNVEDFTCGQAPIIENVFDGKNSDEEKVSPTRLAKQNEELIEYLGMHPCLSDVSPLTITSSEFFRGRNEKIIDMLKTKNIQRDLDAKISEQVLQTDKDTTFGVNISSQSWKSEKSTKMNDNYALSSLSETRCSSVENALLHTKKSSSSIFSSSEMTKSNEKNDCPRTIVSNDKENSSHMDKENQPFNMSLVPVSNAKVNPHQQNRHKGPPSGLCLSPVQRTPMQARKWRDLAAAAAAKDLKKSTDRKKKLGKKKKKKRKVMGNILNE